MKMGAHVSGKGVEWGKAGCDEPDTESFTGGVTSSTTFMGVANGQRKRTGFIIGGGGRGRVRWEMSRTGRGTATSDEGPKGLEGSERKTRSPHNHQVPMLKQARTTKWVGESRSTERLTKYTG